MAELPALSPHPGYRPCTGIVLFNRDSRVFVGRRRGLASSELYAWQMPQGGIEEGEDPRQAAIRELYEETNVRSVELLAEAPEWLAYELPTDFEGKTWKGRWRGQTQKWFAFRFTGEESEIDTARPGGGMHKPEFEDWRWEELERLPDLIVPFKRPVYERVAALFRVAAKPG